MPPAVIADLLWNHTLFNGELNTLRPPYRRYALTVTGVRRAALGVGTVLAREQAAEVAGVLISISMALADRAAPLTHEDDRAAARIAGEVEACMAWRQLAGGAAS